MSFDKVTPVIGKSTSIELETAAVVVAEVGDPVGAVVGADVGDPVGADVGAGVGIVGIVVGADVQTPSLSLVAEHDTK